MVCGGTGDALWSSRTFLADLVSIRLPGFSDVDQMPISSL